MKRTHTGASAAMMLIAALLLAIPPGVASASSDREPPGKAVATDRARGGPFTLEEATIADVQAAFAHGSLTCVELVQGYLDRIEAYEENGPELNAITTVNPGHWRPPPPWMPSTPGSARAAGCTASRRYSRTTSTPTTCPPATARCC